MATPLRKVINSGVSSDNLETHSMACYILPRAPVVLNAQESADITGIVTDSTGVAVPHVTITLT